ncbi:MAG: class I SAM-dependent methyltransferase [Alphaproteobacteria bacterium]|nr:MAG: class I SAM-dependent methyltransferase [Alphaproteobacteria bacterium]
MEEKTLSPLRAPSGEVESELNRVPRVLRRVFREISRIEFGQLHIELPDGRRLSFVGENQGPQGTLKLNSYRAIWAFVVGGALGFSEAYVAGHWESPNLTALLEVFVANRRMLERMRHTGKIVKPFHKAMHALHRNTRRGARKNITAHYDLGNKFYGEWLDETMTYSSARFAREDMTLSEAQKQKYRELAARLDIQPGHRVLEIGCGWGGFAEFAAREIGCPVTAITISRQQYDFAKKRISDAGLGHLVEVRFCDYRDTQDQFDRIVSIEMIEAVGEAFWPAYFGTLRDRLVPGGQAGLQVITIEDGAFDGYRKSPDFIQRHIFPGGMLLSRTVLIEQIKKAGLLPGELFPFGLDYGRTLHLWSERFNAAWKKITKQGFDERFKRLWDYYLSYCEAGFKGGSLDVLQVTMQKPANS